jgi:hypothetical protein
MNYGINSEGRFSEVANGTLSVSGTVYRNALEGFHVHMIVTPGFIRAPRKTALRALQTRFMVMYYNFVIWYRGTFSV